MFTAVIIAVASLVLLFLGRCFSMNGESVLPDGSLSPGTKVEYPENRSGSVNARDVDSAARSELTRGWMHSGEDPDEIAAALGDAHVLEGREYKLSADYLGLTGWGLGYALEDDDFGRDTVACMERYQNRVAGNCVWSISTVVRKERDETSRVVFVDLSPSEHNHADPLCDEWMACTRKAWENRQAPSMKAFDTGLVALRTGSFSSIRHAPFKGSALVGHYQKNVRWAESGMERSRETIENAEHEMQVNMAKHQYEFYEGMHSHLTMLLERMGESP